MNFQSRSKVWLDACIGPIGGANKLERNHRFLEEALELVQACGTTKDEAHQLVEYVFGRDIGDIPQEIGGVMCTLAALCNAQEHNMEWCGEQELARCWTIIDKIRAKHLAKPKFGPLPQ